jgi:hypothetical protein
MEGISTATDRQLLSLCNGGGSPLILDLIGGG